jgi:hypothetical protein
MQSGSYIAVEVKREIFRKCFLMFKGQQNWTKSVLSQISLFPLFTRADRFYWQTNNTRKRQMALVRAEADFPKRYDSIMKIP